MPKVINKSSRSISSIDQKNSQDSIHAIDAQSLDSALQSGGNRASGKLTKKLLLAAPAGLYLASNVGFPSIFAEVIASSISAKLVQWKQIVKARANGRLCYIYSDKDEFVLQRDAWIAQVLLARGLTLCKCTGVVSADSSIGFRSC